ncbi:hypothetical protein ELS24_10280 [Achromobacter spanius]|uniref:hypothetical protein n=1 Tax=Achromobacter spanius TaxID=217203 RepID=UPI000F8FAFDB|nr:hypothetical protein [Achromobacter spanius]AZS78797.1 hypothetical protein ELS24_10280 [Achromobacter spanius]
MQLDTRIPLQAQGPQIENPINALFNATRLRSAQSQVGEQERQIGERNALADVLRQPGTFGADGSFNRAALPAIAQAAPGSVAQYAGLANQQDASQGQADARRMQAAKQSMEIQGRLLQGVRDEQSYQAAKQQAQQYGIDVSQFPANYDPAFVQQALARTMSQMDQFDMLYKQESLNLQRQRLEAGKTGPVGQPFEATGPNGAPILAQRYGDGSIKPVEGFGPKARSDGMTIMTNPDGTATITQGGQTPKLTEGQSKDLLFGTRAQEADKIINNLVSPPDGKEGVNFLQAQTLGGDGIGRTIKNWMAPANVQKFNQAKRDFINAVLRKESGAVISPDEFANAEQQYFPQSGDTDEVIEQKARNRDLAARGILAGVPGVARDNLTSGGRQNPTTGPQPTGAGGVLSPAPTAARAVARTGTLDGRKVVEYSDGSVEYAD